MAIQIIYKPLFEVKILHHYFLDKGGETDDYVFFEHASDEEKDLMLARYDIRSFLTINPAASTIAQLKRFNCVFRLVNDGFVVMIKAKYDEDLDAFVPFTELSNDLSFKFEYRITDNTFLNFTNLPLQKISVSSIFYFENKTNGSARNAPNLSSLAPLRDTNLIYNAGEILRNADASRTLIANRITTDNDNPQQNFTTDFLVNDSVVHYVNANDVMKTSYRIVYIDTGFTIDHEELIVTVVNERGETIEPRITFTDQDTTHVQVDLSGYEDGAYHVTVEDDEDGIVLQEKYYVLQQLSKVDGIINIHAVSDSASFNLLESDGSLSGSGNVRQFILRFKNRATIWRYKGNNFMLSAPESGPHLITQNGFVNITISDDDNTSINDPPNATPVMLVVEKPDIAPGHYNLYSDIFFNT